MCLFALIRFAEAIFSMFLEREGKWMREKGREVGFCVLIKVNGKMEEGNNIEQ